MIEIKKDFLATVKKIREEMGGDIYPRASMNKAQYAKGTATINGGPGCTHEMARQILDSDHLFNFMRRQGAGAVIEITKDANGKEVPYIRIGYMPEHLKSK